MEWMDEALCLGKHQDLWYPPLELPRKDHSAYYDVASLVCDRCPVRGECSLEGDSQEYGMWGGRTPLDRRKGAPRKIPKKALSMTAIHTLIPRHIPDTPVDIRPLRTTILSVAVKR